jgi:thiamine biosynthesis lipoprotein
MTQAAQTPAPAPLPTLEQSFELLKEFKVGTDSTVLIPIERAVMEVHGNETARAALEKRLAAYLGSSYSSVTRAFVCRQLVLIGSAASDVDRALRSTLDRIEGLMSTWDRDSELSRFNRSTSLEPFAFSPETFEVFKWSIEVGGLTGGALDVTIGPLVDAWGFGPSGPRNAVPTQEEIARLREAVGLDRIELDPAARTVRKTRPEVGCDLSSVVPGYAADRLSAELSNRGFTDFLVDVGGEVRTRGRNETGAAWQVAIERPSQRSDTIQRMVPISDLAITTAGDYRKYREVDGQRIAHILDPRTGRPLTHRLASVTVIDALAVRADAFDTALMVLGPDEGMALATKLNLAALFIERTGDGFTERATARFDEIVAKR